MFFPLLTVDNIGPRWVIRDGVGVTLGPLRNYTRFVNRPPTAEESAAMAAIVQYAEPTDLVVTDDQKLAYWAGRSSPPKMCDTSDVRIQSGYLTLNDAIKDTQTARVVLLWRGWLDAIPGYREWLTKSGWRAVPITDSHVLYIRADSQ